LNEATCDSYFVTDTRPSLDVVLQPGGGLPLSPVLKYASDGTLNLAWVGNGTVFYSRAYASHAYSAQNWTKPYSIIPAQADIGMIDLAVGGNGAHPCCICKEDRC
jgi:hypothetical protein